MAEHPTQLQGFDSLEEAASAVENLRYDALRTFLFELREALLRRAATDRSDGKVQLSKGLEGVGARLLSAACEMDMVWRICEAHELQDRKR